MINAFIRKHSVSVYFALTFAISWSGVSGVVGPGGFPGTPGQFQTLLPIAIAVMIAGVPLLVFDLAWFTAVWIVLASVGRSKRWHLARGHLQARVVGSDWCAR